MAEIGMSMMRENENNSIAVLVALLLMAVLGLVGLAGFVFLQRNRAMEQAMIAKHHASKVAQEQAILAKEQSTLATRAGTQQEKLLSSIAQEAQKGALDNQQLAERTREALELQIANLSLKLEATEAALREERMQREVAEAAKMEALKATEQANEVRAIAEALAAELAKVKQELAKANDKQ